MQDAYRCQLCRVRISPRGITDKTIHFHYLCVARAKLGKPTPKLRHAHFTKPKRQAAEAKGIREMFKLSDALTRR